MDISPATRRGMAVAVVLLLSVVSFLAGRATVSRPAAADDSAAVVILGPWGYYSLSDVTPVIVAAPEQLDLLQPVHVFIVRLDDDRLIALDGRDPYMRCPMDWDGGAGHFVDRCHDYEFTRTGEPVLGPPGAEPRALERFGLRVLPNEDLEVDFTGDSAAAPPTTSPCESGPDEPLCASPGGG